MLYNNGKGSSTINEKEMTRIIEADYKKYFGEING